MAHNGILFLDELPEFPRDVLEMLRQPIEDGKVTIARSNMTLSFPAGFTLVSAMNPCPCGFYGDASRECRCTPPQVARYRDRLSGPLRDRLDLLVDVPALPPDILTTDAHGEPSAAVRARVVAARRCQRERFQPAGIRTNAELTPSLAARHCALDRACIRLMQSSIARFGLSARGYDRVRAVARTIADLAGAAGIDADHLAEALQFRPM